MIRIIVGFFVILAIALVVIHGIFWGLLIFLSITIGLTGLVAFYLWLRREAISRLRHPVDSVRQHLRGVENVDASEEYRAANMRRLWERFDQLSSRKKKVVAPQIISTILKIATSQWEHESLRIFAINLLFHVDPLYQSAISILESVAYSKDGCDSRLVRSRAESVAGAIRGKIAELSPPDKDNINRVIN